MIFADIFIDDEQLSILRKTLSESSGFHGFLEIFVFAEKQNELNVLFTCFGIILEQTNIA